MSEWKDRLGGKRLIFTVTSGRSGSHYLTRLLHYLPKMDVFHEEMTHSYHTVLRANQENPKVGMDFLTEKKLPFIESCKQSIFAETSHLICKGFLEHFLELGLVPDLILLSRDRRKIATSLFRLGTIPGRQEKALQFYLMPSDRDVRTAEDWTSWSDYQLCYWHVLEIERRQRHYKQVFEKLGARVHACDLDDLTTSAGYKSLINEMGFKRPGLINWLKFLRSKQKRAGDFTKSKNQRNLPDDIESQESAIKSLFSES
jgi:hypothetical protein